MAASHAQEVVWLLTVRSRVPALSQAMTCLGRTVWATHICGPQTRLLHVAVRASVSVDSARSRCATRNAPSATVFCLATARPPRGGLGGARPACFAKRVGRGRPVLNGGEHCANRPPTTATEGPRLASSFERWPGHQRRSKVDGEGRGADAATAAQQSQSRRFLSLGQHRRCLFVRGHRDFCVARQPSPYPESHHPHSVYTFDALHHPTRWSRTGMGRRGSARGAKAGGRECGSAAGRGRREEGDTREEDD